MMALLYWWFLEPAFVLAMTYVAVAFIARRFGRLLSISATLGIALLIAYPVWLVIPEWDNIIGRKQFSDLCAEKAGVQVLRRVQVAKDQMEPNGLPIFYKGSATLSKSAPKDPEEAASARYVIESHFDLFGAEYNFVKRSETYWVVPRFSFAKIVVETESLYEAKGSTLLGTRVVARFIPGGKPPVIGGTSDPVLECPRPNIGDGFGRALAKAVFYSTP